MKFQSFKGRTHSLAEWNHLVHLLPWFSKPLRTYTMHKNALYATAQRNIGLLWCVGMSFVTFAFKPWWPNHTLFLAPSAGLCKESVLSKNCKPYDTKISLKWVDFIYFIYFVWILAINRTWNILKFFIVFINCFIML